MLKENKTKENKVDINNNLEDEHLKELKKAVDKSFKTKYTNKKKIATTALCLFGLAAIGVATPIIVSNANAKVDVTVKSSNTAMEKYKVKVKKGTKISKIKVVELEGYDFVGFFKDEACTKPYKSSDTIKKDATIYASYKVKSINNTPGETVTPQEPVDIPIEYTVIVNGQEKVIPSFSDITIGEAIKEITTLPYETSGVVYLDEACTLEADLNATMTSNTTLYTKAATLDKLSFTWDSATSSWSVGANGSTAGEVVIPASYTDGTNTGSITAIGNSAFSFCYGLTEITIPNTVTTIGNFAFYYCNIKSISIPSGVTTIGNSVFSSCRGLTEIAIPNSVTTIGSSAFKLCSGLTSITIPSSVTTIGDSALYGCGELNSITVEEGNSKYHTSGNCLIETSSKTLIQGCKTSAIPTDGSVTTIGNSAFYGFNGLSTITIPDNVTKIGDYVFQNCTGLNTIEIPNSVTSIGAGAFSNCSGLTAIMIPSGITTIGDYLFKNCSSLTEITIPKNVTTIGNYAFQGCGGLTSITVEDGNTNYHSAGNCLIETASKTLVLGCKTSVIPSDGSVTTIGNGSFYGCSGLTSITIPNSVIDIREWSFRECSSLTAITVEAGNTKYHSSGNCLIETASKTLIKGCNTSVIPSDGSVTIIESNAFVGCSGLTSITIPDTVDTIDTGAFYDCENLTSVTIDNAKIARSLKIISDNGNIIAEATTVYIKSGLVTSNSTYLTSNYTKQATSDKDGYDKWVKNS